MVTASSTGYELKVGATVGSAVWMWLGLVVGDVVMVPSWWWCLWCLWLGLTVGSAVVSSASVDGANVGLTLAKVIGL